MCTYMDKRIPIHIFVYLCIYLYSEKHVLKVVKQSECLVKASRENSRALFEFGQSMTVLGNCEGGFICVFICLQLYL
jgi:hypothetical protein